MKNLIFVTIIGSLNFFSQIIYSAEPNNNPVEAHKNQLIIQLNQDSKNPYFGTVEILGLNSEVLINLSQAELTTSQWKTVFPVFVGDAMPDEATGKLPMLGSYQVEEHLVRFVPRFPLVAGLSYYSRFDFAVLRKLLNQPVDTAAKPVVVEAIFNIPKLAVEATTVVKQVYPTASMLPENQLKLYIHFSAPMRRGNIYRHIRLLDASGQEVYQPFIEIEQELWDPQSQRLTLFFDPGRIKRGLRPHREAGLALTAGGSYQLVIAKTMQDAAGVPLAAEFRKSFQITTPDRTSPDYHSWKITPPPSGTTEPVFIVFSEPLDHALLERLITIVDATETPLHGTKNSFDEETKWAFTPNQPWKAGEYYLRLSTALEDLAGNSLDRLFDADMHHQQTASKDFQIINLPFRVENLSQ